MHQDIRLSAIGQSPADAFLRSILLAAFLLAALRTPRAMFALRAMVPGELAGPGEVLASCLAGLSAGVLACDARGRFVLASHVASVPSVSLRWLRWNLRTARPLRASARRTATSTSALVRREGV